MWTPRVRKTFHGIKGMTDRPSVQPRLPVIGRLRKGTSEEREGKGGRKYKVPVDLDYFLFTSDNEKVVAAFREVYGDQPRLVNVRLPYPSPEENFQTCMEEWRGGGLIHRCDGHTMSLWLDSKGLYREEEQPCPYYENPALRVKADREKGIKANPGCVEVGRLNVIIPELLQAGFVGVVTLVTTAVNDILNINNTLWAVAEEQSEYHRDLGRDERTNLRGILWQLRRVPEAISTPGDGGGRVRRVKWLVKIEPAPDWALLQLEMARRAELPQLEAPAWQPQPPDWEDVTTGGRTVAEVEAELFDGADDAPGFAASEDAEEGEFGEAEDAPVATEPHWYDVDEKKLAFLAQLTKFEVAAKDALCYLGVTDWHAIADPRAALSAIWKAHQAAATVEPPTSDAFIEAAGADHAY